MRPEVIKAARIAAPVFEAQGWTYTSGATDALALAETIDDLVEGVLGDPDARNHATGRFMVQRNRDPETGNTESIELYLHLGYIE